MKLLGDDCWWAPRWARRLQNRLGLGEIDLPDEHKRPSVNGRAARPPVKAASLAAAPRPPHDPTHPGPPAPRPAELPSGASTTRLNTRPGQPTEASTARLSVPGQPEGAPPPPPPPVPTRAAPVSGPVPSETASDPADPTAALPVMRPEADDSEAATEKVNARGQADQSDNGDEARPRRRGGGGGVSAADLLRREGRL